MPGFALLSCACAKVRLLTRLALRPTVNLVSFELSPETNWVIPLMPAPLTVTVKLLVPVRLLASVPVQVTLVLPTLNVEPEAGLQTTLIGVAQPLPAGVAKVTTTLELPTAALVTMLAGVATVGAPLVTVTLKLLVPTRVAASVTEQLTAVVPTLNVVPEAGVQTTVPGLLQPVAVGVA